MIVALLTHASLVRAQEREPPAPSPVQIARALQRYAHEPTARELVEALRADPTIDPERARALARRGRRGGWLPWLRLAARRGQARDLSAQVEAETTRYSTDDALTLEASLTFRLDRAAYGPHEVALAREEGRRAQQRERRERALLAAFYERRRLQLERDLCGRTDLETLLRIRELADVLDLLSAGAFHRIMRRRASRDHP